MEWHWYKAKHDNYPTSGLVRNFFVMKRFVACICLRTFICNRSFGVTEDEEKKFLFTQSTSLYTFTNFGQMIG